MIRAFWQQVNLARAPMAGLALVGLFWGGFAGLMPDIKAYAGASDGQFGMAMMFSAAGSMVSMFLAPRIGAFLGRGTLFVVGLSLLAAFHYPLFASDLVMLFVALAMMGATVGLLDISSNIRISAIEADHDMGLMNVSHAMFSFGFGISALLTGIAREAGYDQFQILPVIALVAFLLLLATLEGADRFSAPDDETNHQDVQPSGTFWAVVILTSIVLFSSFIGENSTEAWSALHIERTLGAEVGHGSYGPAVLGFVMGIARLFGQVAADRLGERRLITISAALGALGALVIAVAWSPAIVIVGVAVVAVGMAVIVPSANTVLGRRVPKKLLGLALSRAWMVGMTGFFLGPAVMGLISDLYGLRVSYAVIAAIIAMTIPAIFALGRIPAMERRN